MLALLGTASLIVVYGTSIGTKLDSLDQYVGTKAKSIRHSKEDKRISEANRILEATREYYNALDLEMKTKRHYRQLAEAQKAIAWERQFYGDAPLPSEVQQLEAVVQKAFAIPANVGKQSIVEEPLSVALKPEVVGLPDGSSLRYQRPELVNYATGGVNNVYDSRYDSHVRQVTNMPNGFNLDDPHDVIEALQENMLTVDEATDLLRKIEHRQRPSSYDQDTYR
jgi:hypothetical protein